MTVRWTSVEHGTGGRAEKLGPATLDLLRDRIGRFSTCTIRPVLDLGRADTVDVHDPPGWMRETVILRDARCVFPGFGIDARSCDLDHIEPDRPPDHAGPPAQTDYGWTERTGPSSLKRAGIITMPFTWPVATAESASSTRCSCLTSERATRWRTPGLAPGSSGPGSGLPQGAGWPRRAP